MNEDESIKPDVEAEASISVDDQAVVAEETPTEKQTKKPAKKRKKAKKKPVAHKVEETEEDNSLDVKALREEVKEISSRAKEAGLNPLRRMARAYLDTAFDAVDGLLSALEGSSRKKGK
jgi:hypothetical protein